MKRSFQCGEGRQDSKVLSKLHSMQDSWLSAKGDEIQSYTDRHHTKRFFDVLKAVSGPQYYGSSPLLSADAQPFSHTRSRFMSNGPNTLTVYSTASHNCASFERRGEEEVSKAIKLMTSGKAPGPDAISAEVYKMGSEAIRNQLTSLFQTIWIQEHLPEAFRDATIIHIFKQKGNDQSCNNHRGISLLLFITGKILELVLLNRLLNQLG